MTVTFRRAVADDAARVAALVNSAYRGDSSRAGWTTEADLVAGDRIDAAGISELIDAEDSVVLLCVRDDTIIGSVHLRRTGDTAYLGMLVVEPILQAAGIGKRFLAEAERLVRTEWAVDAIWLTVISVRDELIAYYARRGYHDTGERRPFPAEYGPLVRGLHFAVLEKRLETDR